MLNFQIRGYKLESCIGSLSKFDFSDMINCMKLEKRTLTELIFEDNNFACVNRYTKLIHAEIFEATLTAVTFKENQVYRQETIREEIDNDPSEVQDWNWEEYE